MSHAIREATIVAAKKSGGAMSMRRSVDQIRTTHTGSLPRPPDMLETLHQLAAGHSIDLA